MSYFQYAAISAPHQLFFEIRFWRSNRNLIFVVAVGGALAYLLFDLTYPRGETPVAFLSAIIQVIAVCGLLVSLRAASRLEVDDAIAQRVEMRAVADLERLKGGATKKIELDRLEVLIPHNPNWSGGMIRLLGFVLEEARSRKFHDPALVMQPFRDRSVGDLFHLQTLQRIALQLGILGTFVGLIQAVLNLHGSVNRGLQPPDLAQLLDSLHLSFSTSIAGLEVSVVLGLALMATRGRLERYFSHMEAATKSYISLARRCEIADEYLVEFGQIRHAMEQLRDRIRGHAAEVRLQTQEIQTGLGELVKVKAKFNAFLQDLRGEQAHILSEFKSVYEIISPRKTAEELEAGLVRSMERILKSFEERLRDGLAELEHYNESLDGFRSTLWVMRHHAERSLEELAESRGSLDESALTVGSKMNEMVTVHGRLLEQLEKASRLDIDQIVDDLGELVKETGMSLEREVDRKLAGVHRALEEHRSDYRVSNTLLSTLVDRPTFFFIAFVRPWRWLRKAIVSGIHRLVS